MATEKQIKIQKINDYLEVYNDEQLDLLHQFMNTYSKGMINKGDIMDMAMTREQRGKCDTALPHDYVMRIRELMPSFDAFSYVYDYNEPNTFGSMNNIFETLHNKFQKVFNNEHFEN